MERIDYSEFMLYLEPPKEKKSKKPVNDELTEGMEMAIRLCEVMRLKGAANYSGRGYGSKFDLRDRWRGFHCADDGEVSSNQEYLLPGGFITNSLCVHYLRWYRDYIPESEMEKVKKVCRAVKDVQNLYTVTHG